MPGMFRSERLIYRAIEDSDRAFIGSLYHDADTQLATTGNLPVPQGKRHAKDHLVDHASCMLSAVICIPPPQGDQEDPDEAEPIGVITLKAEGQSRVNARVSRNAKFGITLHREVRGKGYGSEAVKWMLEWAFQQTSLHKVATYVYEFNTPSIKMCEKLGFKADGRMREEVWNDGRYWDDFVFSMLEHEWRGMYGKRRGVSIVG